MFELVVKSSKDVKKITIDFGDESSTVTEVTGSSNNFDSIPVAPPSRDMSDIIAERTAKDKPADKRPYHKKETIKETLTELPVIDVANRPPLIDEDFTKF